MIIIFDKGVRQGDGISPTLFNIFINDIGKIFDQDRSDPLELLESKIGSLLFADDLIILSKSKEGLQKSLDNLSEYCDKWQLTVNVKKSKTMIFQNNCNKLHDPFVKFKGSYLENVKEFKYLGCMLSSNGNLNNSSLDLSKKASKVLFSIKSYTADHGNVPVKVACNLFDTLVKPILTYNSEITFMDNYLKLFRAKQRAEKSESVIDILSFVDKTSIEKVHLRFCKSTLGVKRTCTNLVVREELGRVPIETFIKTQSIMYLLRLNTENINPLLKEAFNLSKSLDQKGVYSWYTYAKEVTEEIPGVGYDSTKLDS